MSKIINHTELTSTLGLTECADGFWLYDKTRGRNLSMKAKTSQDAFVEAITYYQDSLTRLEAAHKELNEKVYNFVNLFVPDEDIDDRLC